MTPLKIDRDYLQKTLSALLEIPSPTGYTDQIARWCCKELESLGIDYELTRRGGIRSRIPGKQSQPARAMVSHVDTLGAQVKRLKENGRLEIVPIGHWSSRFAEGARCTVFNAKGGFRGTILPLKASGHTFNKEIDSQPVTWSNVELRVDAKSKSHEELEDLGFHIGDFIAIDPQPEMLENGYIVSRHLDNKGGVALMFATLQALKSADVTPPVDTLFLFTISEEVGVGASSILTHDVASLIAIDNGTTAPGQNSREFGATIAMADQTGPFDYHLTQKLLRLCEENHIEHQRDIFRFYRSDNASALEGGADVRTALVTFGVDASHGYERVNIHALVSVAELLSCYVQSNVEIKRDAIEAGSLEGFTSQPIEDAPETEIIEDPQDI